MREHGSAGAAALLPVLVSQPTHPMFYKDDERHHRCNVCAAPFNIPPPTRNELMTSFTGAEIAALLTEGCIIGSDEVFSEELESQVGAMPFVQRLTSGYQHWIRGVYLITAVHTDDGTVSLPVKSEATLDRVRAELGGDLALEVGGRRHALVPGGDLAGVGADRLAPALAALRAPAVLLLSTAGPLNPKP